MGNRRNAPTRGDQIAFVTGDCGQFLSEDPTSHASSMSRSAISVTFAHWREAEAALEAYVLKAGPDKDAGLIKLFNAIESRAMQVFGGTAIGHSASNVHLPPTR